MQACMNCKHVERQEDDEDFTIVYRCGAPLPFWVPLPDTDYKSRVTGTDGSDCQMYAKDDRYEGETGLRELQRLGQLAELDDK